MKVVYIKLDDEHNGLTIGKSYETLPNPKIIGVNSNTGQEYYSIINDNGREVYPNTKCFQTLDEYRSEQLNKILEN